MVPNRGPSVGGTLITVSGANITSAATRPGLREGSLLCRFGRLEEAVVPAKLASGSDSLQCETPPNPRQDGGTEVRECIDGVGS